MKILKKKIEETKMVSNLCLQKIAEAVTVKMGKNCKKVTVKMGKNC